MVADDQLQIYDELFKPAVFDIVQMQLTGMPVDPVAIAEAKKVFLEDSEAAVKIIRKHKWVRQFSYMLEEDHVEKRNATLKKKRIKIGDEPQQFNPNSPPQKQRLLYEVLELPVIERTKTKLPATGSSVLEKLKAYTEDPEIKYLLDALLEFSVVDKLLNTFIPALESAVLAPDGCHYLFGNFNLGGTVSGRLSSSEPNLQTIPSKKNKFAKKDYSKLIKKCFIAPKGWVMIGLDFNSLEDMISALTTKDPNKLKVYTDGFDGHCLRAQSYFSENMPDVEVAPEGARCFKAVVGEKIIYFHENEEVEYQGTKMTGLELWNRLANVRETA
jgi:DNA polymerase-1